MAKTAAAKPKVDVNLDELKQVLDEVLNATGEFMLDGAELNLRSGDIYINAAYTQPPSKWKVTLRTEPFTLT